MGEFALQSKHWLSGGMFLWGPLSHDMMECPLTFLVRMLGPVLRDWIVSEIVDGHMTVIPNFVNDYEDCALQHNLFKWELRIRTLLLA
eukprot:15194958-Ditylum_brightwellii.AAC.1